MSKPILFDPNDYANLSSADLALLQTGYSRAKEAIDRNITPLGFSACSLEDNQVLGTDANYRSVWARDGAKTLIWTLELEEEHIRNCQRQTLHTILSHQAPAGQLPAHVLIDTNEPEYGGIGGITSIDSALWTVIAVYHFCRHTGEWSFADEYREVLQKTMDWLSALDANNCGLIEIPEAGDWTDLFARSYLLTTPA